VKAARGLAGLQAINRIPPMKITEAAETHTTYDYIVLQACIYQIYQNENLEKNPPVSTHLLTILVLFSCFII
jgi:hypothetical protein